MTDPKIDPMPKPADKVSQESMTVISDFFKDYVDCEGIKMHRSCEQIFKFFSYKHLPEHLIPVSHAFYGLAKEMIFKLKDGPEKTVCLRKLLEAKDCAVRSAL